MLMFDPDFRLAFRLDSLTCIGLRFPGLRCSSHRAATARLRRYVPKPQKHGLPVCQSQVPIVGDCCSVKRSEWADSIKCSVHIIAREVINSPGILLRQTAKALWHCLQAKQVVHPFSRDLRNSISRNLIFKVQGSKFKADLNEVFIRAVLVTGNWIDVMNNDELMSLMSTFLFSST